MKTHYAAVAYDAKTARLTLSIDLDPSETLTVMLVDNVRQPGSFIATPYGWLYRHTDGVYGLPGLCFGNHSVTVRHRAINATNVQNMNTAINVPNPPSTLGPDRIWPPEGLLPYLYDAGFHDEQNLLNPFSIACGESGYYTKARNWLPSQGFRTSGSPLGVVGPDAAWNKNSPRDPSARQGNSDRGLFQINSFFHSQFTDAQCDDPAQACQAIAVMSNHGADWTAWGFGAGATHYSQFWDTSVHGFPALRPLVQEFLATKAA